MKKIAIIGCGISGLYFANKLLSKRIYDFTIYEKKSEIDLNDGYGIQLSVNSIKLLNEIGFNNITANEIFFPKRVNFFDAKTCKKICEIDISKFNSENKRYTTLKRSILIKFLLNNIPAEKVKSNLEVARVEHSDKVKLHFSNNTIEEFDYLVVSDGVFSKTKSIILEKDVSPKFFNSVALRGNIKNIDNNDISLYLGPNFHFVIYPVNQNKEFNFISIIRKKLNNNEIFKRNFFENREFLKSLSSEIYQKTSLNLADKLENIKSFPVYVSKKLADCNYKNIYFIGDALFSFPPSFAQGASQSIEAANEAFEEINNNTYNYYKNRRLKIKEVNLRSKLNHFVFHLSNPISILFRNFILKKLTNSKFFLNNYLGKIYRD